MSLGDGASAASALRSLVSEAFSRGLRPLPTCTVPAEAMPGDEGPPVEEPPCDKTSPTTIGGTSEGIASMTSGESGHMPCVFQDWVPEGSLAGNFRVGFRLIFGQTWPQDPSRSTGLVLQCRLHQKSAPQTNSKPFRCANKLRPDCRQVPSSKTVRQTET